MFKSLALRLFRRDDAATAVEYAVMLGLILLVALVAIAGLGSTNGSGWNGIDTDLQNAGLGGS
jgi:Flp pilus assembly pilin Flp